MKSGYCLKTRLIIFTFIVIYLFYLYPVLAKAMNDKAYNPPFEIYGEVEEVTEAGLKVYVPYINKQVDIIVLPQTLISNRIDEQKRQYRLQIIKAKDLVIIKGVLKENQFLSKEISFLSTSSD